jgi:hypothetical protein
MVKTKAGMTDEYPKASLKPLKASLEEAKKQNLVVDYKILLGGAATPQDFDILIMVESRTWPRRITRAKVRPDRQKSRGHN